MDTEAQTSGHVPKKSFFTWRRFVIGYFTWVVVGAVVGTFGVIALREETDDAGHTSRSLRGLFDRGEDTDIPFECINDDDCGNHGECVAAPDNGTMCVCDPEFRSVGEGVCNYRRRSPVTAVILSAVVGGVGADWFYLSRGDGVYIFAGVMKLLTLGGCGVWSIVDVIRVATETFPDGNGHRLVRWSDV